MYREINRNRIWVTWEVQRRNRSLSSKFNAKLYEIICKSNRIMRYFILSIKTISIYIKENPKFIFVQNPSIVLSFITMIYGRIKNKFVIIDAHNAGLFPFEGKYWIFNKINDYIIQYSSMVIVTNDNLCEYVRLKKGYPFTLPDPIPKIPTNSCAMTLKGEKIIFFICTYSNDEPYMEVINAARLIPNEYNIYISGKIKKNITDKNIAIPDNVTLTGYLTEEDFVGMLHAAEIIIDLTTRDNCLVCGAYEGIALGKPLILSDTVSTRKYFNKGVIYTKNDYISISSNILNAVNEIHKLREQSALLKIELEMDFENKLKDIEKILCSYPH